jgi:hypothetical protein
MQIPEDIPNLIRNGGEKLEIKAIKAKRVLILLTTRRLFICSQKRMKRI